MLFRIKFPFEYIIKYFYFYIIIACRQCSGYTKRQITNLIYTKISKTGILSSPDPPDFRYIINIYGRCPYKKTNLKLKCMYSPPSYNYTYPSPNPLPSLRKAGGLSCCKSIVSPLFALAERGAGGVST